MLSSHGGLLTISIASQRNNLIKLTDYDETKKRAHHPKRFRAKENVKLSHGGPSNRQASGTKLPLKALRGSRHNYIQKWILLGQNLSASGDGVNPSNDWFSAPAVGIKLFFLKCLPMKELTQL